MHELSMVMSILDTVEENAKVHNAVSVSEIELEVGELSGVEFEALEFAFECAQRTELLKNAKVIINKISAMARCKSCNNEFETSDYYTPCPECNNYDFDVIKGKELKIKSIKID